MKQIDVKKLEKIKDKHLEYCRNLIPDIEPDICELLCCKDPFDFTNINPENPKNKYLKKDYWNFVDGNIDYEKFYTSFRSPHCAPKRNKDWNGIELLKAIEVDVCPYCGMNYISSISKDKKSGNIRAVATFDHYLPKADYKFLALNLYNLIPSCKNCNSTFKLKNSKHIINPFLAEVEQRLTFYIDCKNIIKEILKTENKPQIDIIYDPSDELVKNHVNVLSLKERYNYFSNIAKSLIIKRYKYNNSFLTKLENIFKNFSKIQFEQDIIKQDIISKDEVFSKFKSDIWKQLSKK